MEILIIFAVLAVIGALRTGGKRGLRIVAAIAGGFVAMLIVAMAIEIFELQADNPAVASFLFLFILVGGYYGVNLYLNALDRRKESGKASDHAGPTSFSAPAPKIATVEPETEEVPKQPPLDLNEIEQIRMGISQGELDGSLEQLLDVVIRHYAKSRSQVIALNARYELIQKEYLAGIIDYETKSLQENQLIASTLNIIDDLEKRFKS